MIRDVRFWQAAILTTVVSSLGARYQTANFVVEAPTSSVARQVGVAAETCRRDLAVAWLGRSMPRWYAPCHIKVNVGNVGAGGATTFSFERGETGRMEVFGWRMTGQGTLERILDSVLPHEISHTIFACHFRRPLPRWADEGAATLAENASEKQRQTHRAQQVVRTQRQYPLRTLLSVTEYPPDMDNVLTLYAQGYTLAAYLIRQGGRQRYLSFLAEAHRSGWDQAIHKHYGLRGIDDLEKRWQGWVLAGGPEVRSPSGRFVAGNSKRTASRSQPAPVVRSQTPDSTARQPVWHVRPPVSLVSGTAPIVTRPERSEVSQAHQAAHVETRSSYPQLGGHSAPVRGEGLHAPDPRSLTEIIGARQPMGAMPAARVVLRGAGRREGSAAPATRSIQARPIPRSDLVSAWRHTTSRRDPAIGTRIQDNPRTLPNDPSKQFGTED